MPVPAFLNSKFYLSGVDVFRLFKSCLSQFFVSKRAADISETSGNVVGLQFIIEKKRVFMSLRTFQSLRIWLVVVVLAWVAETSASPNETAELYVQHLLAGEVAEMANLYHPDALVFIHESMLPVVRFEIENEIEGSFASRVFPGLTYDAIADLTPESFAKSLVIELLGIFNEAQSLIKVSALQGYIQDGDISHVLLKVSAVGITSTWESTRIAPLSLKRHYDDWLIVPSDHVMEFIDTYIEKYERSKDSGVQAAE